MTEHKETIKVAIGDYQVEYIVDNDNTTYWCIYTESEEGLEAQMTNTTPSIQQAIDEVTELINPDN